MYETIAVCSKQTAYQLDLQSCMFLVVVTLVLTEQIYEQPALQLQVLVRNAFRLLKFFSGDRLANIMMRRRDDRGAKVNPAAG